MTKVDCNICNIGDAPDGTTLFLGLTVESYSASTGWEGTTSTLTVNLIMDDCAGRKYYWDNTLTQQIHTGPDPGFLGLPQYQRASDSSLYRACSKENPSDTLVAPAQNIVGSSAFFRMGDWEWCGIIRNWTEDTSSNGNKFSVTLVDPRIILEQSQVITGEYAGITSFTNATSGLTTNNVFNIFGFAEQFGCYCPPYSQCSTGNYGVVDCPTNCCGIDGTVFGTPIGGFGGSFHNEKGIPARVFFKSFNMLVNSIPIYSPALLFSPYGRVVYKAPDVANYGLMPKDAQVGNPGYEHDISYYFIDLSELEGVINSFGGLDTYRIQGPVLSISDVISQICDDFGCDFYIDLVPIKNAAASPSGIDKFIKVRIVDRSLQPAVGEVCSFIESVNDCLVSKSQGCELRNDTTSAFIVGGNKQTVYQAEQNYNPDENFTLVPNSDDTLASLSPFTNSMLSVSPDCSGGAIDDMILPYFGTYQDGDYIQPCYGSFGWEFWAPTDDLLMSLNFSSDILVSQLPSIPSRILITEQELRATEKDVDDWHAVIAAMRSQTYSDILSPLGLFPLKVIDAKIADIIATRERILGRDIAGPARGKFKNIKEDIKNDIRQRVYSWVKKYYDEYYGTKFMVRVPFTCAKPDLDTGKLRFSEYPTNDGGWTEEPRVIGLPNNEGISNRTVTQASPIGHFKDQSTGKIKPFVRFNECNAALEYENNENFLVYYELNPSDAGLVTFGDGDPSPLTALTSPPDRIYIDNETYMIWVWAPNDPVADPGGPGSWVLWNQTAVSYFDSSPSGTPAQLGILTTTRIYDCANNKMYIYSGNTDWAEFTISVYIKADIEEEYVFYEKSLAYGPRVVVSINNPVRENTDRSRISGTDVIIRDVRNGLALAELERFKEDGIQEGVDFKDSYISIAPQSWLPQAAAIPMFHNDITYGPWQCVGTTGETKVEKDDSLVPWTFGGYEGLNIAGELSAQSNCSAMSVAETGSVEVVGLPTIPLGAEIGALAGGFYGGGTQLIENRTRTDILLTGTAADSTTINVTYGYFTYGAVWTGLYGPNITSISLSGGRSGYTTTYSFSTFTSRRNLLLKKQLDRLKNKDAVLPQLINKLVNSVVGTKLSSIVNRQRRVEKLLSGDIESTRSPHEVFTGRLEHWLTVSGLDESGIPLEDRQSVEGFRRPVIVSEKLSETNVQIHNAYASKAIMSIDGLLRPVSVNGQRGNLPRYIQYSLDSSGCNVYDDCIESSVIRVNYNGTSINQDDLNPVTNPSGLERSYIASNRSDTPLVGHDYEILARFNPEPSGSGLDQLIPSGGMIIPYAGYGENDYSGDYTDDYGLMAIKGPILIQQWGYDKNDRPVPNKNDDEYNAANGIFLDGSGLHQTKFLDGHLRKSHTWPVAPLDLRLNKDRGVWEAWAANGIHEIITAKIGCCGPSSNGGSLGGLPPVSSDGQLFYPGDIGLVDTTLNISGDLYGSGCDGFVSAINLTSDIFFPGDTIYLKPYTGDFNACYEIFGGNPTKLVDFLITSCVDNISPHGFLETSPYVSGTIFSCDGNTFEVEGKLINLGSVDGGNTLQRIVPGCTTGVARIERCYSCDNTCDSVLDIRAISLDNLLPEIIPYSRGEIDSSGNAMGSPGHEAGLFCTANNYECAASFSHLNIKYPISFLETSGCSPATDPDYGEGIGLFCGYDCSDPSGIPTYIGYDSSSPTLTVNGQPINNLIFEGACDESGVEVSGCTAIINLGVDVSGEPVTNFLFERCDGSGVEISGCTAIVDLDTYVNGSGVTHLEFDDCGLNVEIDGCTANISLSGYTGVTESLKNVWCDESGLIGEIDYLTYNCGLLVDVSGSISRLTAPEIIPMSALPISDCLTCCDGGQECPTDCTTCDNILTITIGPEFDKACACWNGGTIEIEKFASDVTECEWIQNLIYSNTCDCPTSDCDCTPDATGDGVLDCGPDADGAGDPCIYCGDVSTKPCSSTCAQGLETNAASLVCVNGEWILSVSIGTAGGGCPYEQAEWQGSKPVSGPCPPKGSWVLTQTAYSKECNVDTLQCLDVLEITVDLS